MVAHSSEFENIIVRDEEQNELEKLAQTLCPLEVKGGPSNKHGKVSILIQVFICLADQELYTIVLKWTFLFDNYGLCVGCVFRSCIFLGVQLILFR